MINRVINQTLLSSESCSVFVVAMCPPSLRSVCPLFSVYLAVVLNNLRTQSATTLFYISLFFPSFSLQTVPVRQANGIYLLMMANCTCHETSLGVVIVTWMSASLFEGGLDIFILFALCYTFSVDVSSDFKILLFPPPFFFFPSLSLRVKRDSRIFLLIQ